MKQTKGMFRRLTALRKAEMCPSVLNLNFNNYSLKHLLYDIASGTKIYLQLFPIVIALAIFCDGIPIAGIISVAIATLVSVIFGGSKYQISTVAFPLCVLTFEISSKYQYKGLLLTAVLVFIGLVVAGKLRISEIVRFTSHSFMAAIISYVAISVVVIQLQYLLGISSSSLYSSLIGNIRALVDSFTDVTPSSIYNSLYFLSPLLLMKLIFRGYWPYYVYILAFNVLYYLIDVQSVHLPDYITQFERIGKDFVASTNFENIFSISLSLPTKVMMENMITSAFAITIIISVQASFCVNIASSLTGDARAQNNVELISSGLANLVSVSLGGLFVAPDIDLTIKNVQYKAKSVVALMVIGTLAIVTYLFENYVFKYIPIYAMSSILLVFAFSTLFNLEIRKFAFQKNHDCYIYWITLTVALQYGFVPAVLIGFILSLLMFTRRMINIKDASVHTTKNHDSGAFEFVANKYGYINNQDVDPKLLNKVEVIQISNVLYLNLLDIIRKKFIARGQFPSVVIIYFKNVPYLDGSGFSMLRTFVEETTKRDCIVLVSGTNGLLLEILSNKEKDMKSGNIFGYIVPNFSSAVKQTLSRLNPTVQTGPHSYSATSAFAKD